MTFHQDESSLLKAIEDRIGIYPDFPKKGILFRDIMPILRSPHLFSGMIKILASRAEKYKPDLIIGIESRGFLIGPSIARELNLPFVPIRKKGKLPGELHSIKYDLEYGQDVLEIQKGSVPVDSNCLVVDDLIATGGSMEAAKSLIQMSDSRVVAYAVIIELNDLKGREKLGGVPLIPLFSY